VDVPASGDGFENEPDPALIEAESDATHQARPSGTTRAVAGAGAFMIAAALASRILGMGREIAIASVLGQGAEADVYKQAFMVPDILFVLLSSGALASVFVPVFTEYLEKGQKERAWYFFRNALTIVGVVIAVFVILGEIFVHPLTWLTSNGFKDEPWKLQATAELTRIVLPAQIAFFTGSILISVQYAYKKFKLPAVGSMVYNAFIILGGVSLTYGNPLTRMIGYPNGLGAAGFSWGALVGSFAGNIALQAVGVRRLGGRYKPVIDLKDPGVHTFARLMIPIIFTLSLPQLDMQVNKIFATYLRDGSVASLDYANRLMQLPLGILAQASAIALFPFIAGQAARNDMVALRRSVNLALRAITAMTVPASVLMITLAEPIVRLIYQHGKFTAEDTRFTAIILVLYSIGIAAWSAQTILARGFYALQDTATPMITGTFVTVIFVLMNVAVVGPFQDRGLAASTSVAAAILALALFYRLHKRLGGLNGMLILQSLVKVSIAAAVMAGPTYGVRIALTRALAHNAPTTTAMTTGPTILIVVVSSLVGLGVYAAMLWILKVDEARFLAQSLRRKKKPAV
jgi:putative peptidoglycan lipid II flippase